MTLSAAQLRELLAPLWAESEADRGVAADALTDWPDAHDTRTGALVSRAVEVALGVETSERVQESLLHALAELADWGLVPADVIARVCDTGWEQPWAREYVDHLATLRRSDEGTPDHHGRPGPVS